MSGFIDTLRRIRRDRVILAAAVVVTLGAVLSRRCPGTGFYVSIAALAGLLLWSVGRSVAGVVRYRSLGPLERAWVALQAIELIIIINSIISGRILYFPVLLILAAEYFIYDSRAKG